MRIHFPNLSRPKVAAKTLAHQLGVTLSTAQHAVSVGVGYRDWHDLVAATVSGDECSPLDEALSKEERLSRASEIVMRMSETLVIPDGDVQAALAAARLTGNVPPTLTDQIALRLLCWRASSLPATEPRTAGGLGRVRRPNRTGEHAVWLRRFGRPTLVIDHNGITTIADFEYVRPRSQLPPFLPYRLYMPYGIWTTQSGDRVLFSRDYKPLWRVRGDGTVDRELPWLWIREIAQEHHWWDDSMPPWRFSSVRQFVERQVEELGIFTLPILADALPLLIHHEYDPHLSMDDGAELLRAARGLAVRVPEREVHTQQ